MNEKQKKDKIDKAFKNSARKPGKRILDKKGRPLTAEAIEKILKNNGNR